MASLIVRPGALVELAVILFQLLGLISIALFLAAPAVRWARRARRLFIIALLGLGVSGALCSRTDSKFALFAGATLTAYLIGASVATGHHEPVRRVGTGLRSEPVALA